LKFVDQFDNSLAPLESSGPTIHAANALSLGATVVTRNVKQFAKIGLNHVNLLGDAA
jgi:hypothetical protein